MIAGEDLIIGKLWKILQGAIGCLEGGTQAGRQAMLKSTDENQCVCMCVYLNLNFDAWENNLTWLIPAGGR